MAAVRRLAKPPIAEALVDLRIAPEAELDARQFQALKTTLSQRFPKAEDKRAFSGAVTVQAGQVMAASKDLGFVGVYFKSSDETTIAQFRKDGFTLNQLPPYKGGESLIEEALDLWASYSTLAQPDGVVCVAMRYINRLELPYGPGDPVEQFLAAAPQFPGMPALSVRGFLTRIVTEDAASSDTVVITQNLETTGRGAAAPVILDIDAFRTGEFGISASDLRPILDSLRAVKNKVFFSLLTDRAVELYV
jgi:uncharacterized protein (TIGR04255 family)